MNFRAQVLSGIRWSVGVRLVSQLVTWAITLVVIRILTPADYGLLAMATVFISVASIFSELGLGAAVIQRSDIDDGLLRRVFGLIIVIHFGLTGLLIISAPWISLFYGESRLTPVIQVLSLQFIISAFSVIPNAMLQRQLEFKYRSLLDLSSTVLASLITLGLAVYGFGVWALVIGSTTGQVARTIGLNSLAPFAKWPEFSLHGMRSLLGFGGSVTLAQLFGVYITQVDIVICAKLLGNEAVGFYSTAMHLASMPTQRVSAIVNQVAFPAFSSIQHDMVRVRNHVLFGARVLGFFAFPILWGMSSVSAEIVEVILGPRWIASIIPLQILSLIMPIRMIGNMVHVAIQGIGRPDVSLNNIVFASLIVSIALPIGAYYGGLLGMCVGWLIASPISNLQGLLRSLPILGVPPRELFQAMAPAASAAGMYLVVIVAREVMRKMETPSFVRLGLLLAIAAVTYVCMSLTFHRSQTREVIALLRSIGTRRGHEKD